MTKVGFELLSETEPVDALGLVIEAHVERALGIAESNGELEHTYTDGVLRNLRELKALILGASGKIEGLVSSRADQVRPVAEVLFGLEVADPEALQEPFLSLEEEFGIFRPTVFDGLYARVLTLGNYPDGTGKIYSVDVISADHLPQPVPE